MFCDHKMAHIFQAFVTMTMENVVKRSELGYTRE